MPRPRVFKEGEKTLLSVYISGSLYDELYVAAREHEVGMSQLARDVLESYLKERRKRVRAV